MTVLTDQLVKDLRMQTYAEAYIPLNGYTRKIFSGNLHIPGFQGWYPIFDEQAFMLIDDRAENEININADPRPSKSSRFAYSERTINLIGRDHHIQIPADKIIAAKVATITNFEDQCTKGLLAKFENWANLDCFDIMINTDLWSNHAAAYAWDTDNGDPQKDYLKVVAPAVNNATNGMYVPNTMVIGQTALAVMKTNLAVRKAIKYTHATESDYVEKEIAALLGIDKIVEVRAVYNTARKGATKNNSAIFTTSAWFGYIDPAPSINNPSAMAPIVPDAAAGNENGVTIYKAIAIDGVLFGDKTDGLLVNGKTYRSFRQLSPAMGYILTGLYTP